MQILSSYEGQTVHSIEMVGRPAIDTERYAQVLVQHAGEPFSKQKIDATIAALKRDGKFEEIQLQVEPEGMESGSCSFWSQPSISEYSNFQARSGFRIRGWYKFQIIRTRRLLAEARSNATETPR